MQVYSHFTHVLSLSVILSNNYDHIDSGVCRKVGKIDHDIFNIYNMHVICLQWLKKKKKLGWSNAKSDQRNNKCIIL